MTSRRIFRKCVRTVAIVLVVALFATCRRYDYVLSDLCDRLDNHEQRIASLENATEALKARLDAGVMIKSVTPIAEAPGGWRIEFTGGSPSSIDIMNGETPSVDAALFTPQIDVRTGAGGSVTIWYRIGTGQWIDTGVNIKGDTGAPGTPGSQGEKGDPGTPGSQGEKGDPGTPGAQGEKGDPGTPGSQGEKGDPGTPGAQGEKGDPGAPGSQGEKGDPGAPGSQGEKGDPGAPGAQGEKGDPGTPGAQGEKGDPGTPGAQGEKGDPGTPGAQGEKGDPGTPGTAGVSPRVRVVDNGNGTVTIQYNATAGYPDSGWADAGSPIALDSNPLDKVAILSIVDNEATGTVTITLNDNNDPHQSFEFAKASGAVRFELVGFNDRMAIAPDATGSIKFRVNPSNAYVPLTLDKWQLDQTATRASYVTAPTEFALVGVAKDGEKEGQYVATIKCLASKFDYMDPDYAMALVLDAGTAAAPALVSSSSFGLGVEGPGVIATGPTGHLTWILHEDYTLVVKGTGPMPDYHSYGPWETYRDEIEKVVIGGGVASIGNRAFSNCTALTEVTILDGVKSIGEFAFSDCTALAEITLPASVTSIRGGAFLNCAALTKINIPDGVTTIESAVFKGCTALANIAIPDGVTTIGGEAFARCASLKEVTIPAGVTSIGNWAFEYCDALANVTCLVPVPLSLDYYSFRKNTADVLHVPAGSLAAYQGAKAWADVFASIEAIP